MTTSANGRLGDWAVGRLASMIERVNRVAAVVRRIIGVPDYERYLAHVHSHHPGCAPMTKEEFTAQRLADRYSRPGNRCC